MRNLFLEKLNIGIAIIVGLTILGIVFFRVIPSNIATKSISNQPHNSGMSVADNSVNNGNQGRTSEVLTDDTKPTGTYIPPEDDFNFSQKATPKPGSTGNYDDYLEKYNAQAQSQRKAKFATKQSKEDILLQLKANPININTASVTELELLPGIGPVIAKRIVEYRKKIGRYKSINQLIDVNGIGEKKLRDVKPYVRI